MANQQRTGFGNPVTSLLGASCSPGAIQGHIASGYSTAVFMGDPVKAVTSGVIQVCAAGEIVFGVSQGGKYKDPTTGLLTDNNHVPASVTFSEDSKRTRIGIIPALPITIWECDADDGVTVATLAVARSVIHRNVNHVVGTGDSQTGRSAAALDISSVTTSSAQWRLLELIESGVDYALTNARYRIVCNEIFWPGIAATTGGV